MNAARCGGFDHKCQVNSKVWFKMYLCVYFSPYCFFKCNPNFEIVGKSNLEPEFRVCIIGIWRTGYRARHRHPSIRVTIWHLKSPGLIFSGKFWRIYFCQINKI